MRKKKTSEIEPFHASSLMATSACGGGGRRLLPMEEMVMLLCAFSFLFSSLGLGEAYDTLDPNGNITVKWDVKQTTDVGYIAMVTIYNYQLYRHVERPGWKLGWVWPGDEVIWDIRGAEATEQGNCSRFRGDLPHCCDKKPVIVDLLPGTQYNYQVNNCCKGGVLSSTAQNPSKNAASFQMDVGVAELNVNNELPNPTGFSLGLPGYTCGQVFNATPSKFRSIDGRRKTQALKTWKVTCSYSQRRASPGPTCCVSLSAFYSDTIIECPKCSCACPRDPSTMNCSRDDEQAPVLHLPLGKPPFVRCTQHLCPIQVHWHVKASYREYWRAKVTVTNYDLRRNFSEWNLVVKHPNFENLTQVFSFNHESLDVSGPNNDTVMFWGIQYYNDVLLRYGASGNVQTEMLLHKDPGVFTFDAGWAFPRMIVFNGEDCAVPAPNIYPMLPNGSPRPALPNHRPSLGLSPLVFLLLVLVF